MKKIEAVILPLHLDVVQRELQRIGIGGELTVMEVRHSDNDKRLLPSARGASRAFRERLKLELFVDDSETEKVVNVILRHAQSESDQDGGQITVLEANQSLSRPRIKTW
jgi:nitrogen regulatory protein PII